MSKDHDAPAYTARWAQLHGGPVSAPQPVAPGARAIPLREVGRAPVAPPQAVSDPIVASVCALLLSRSAVGVAKYGVTLARDDLSRKQWLVHARDEALDMALYLQRLIEMEDGE